MKPRHFFKSSVRIGSRKASRSTSGLTAIEVVILIPAVILLALLVFGPSFRSNSRSSAPAHACENNLRQIDAAKQQWMLENNVTNLSVVPTAADVQPYMGRSGLPYCPLDKNKSFTTS
jgi:hypothetical protein